MLASTSLIGGLTHTISGIVGACGAIRRKRIGFSSNASVNVVHSPKPRLGELLGVARQLGSVCGERDVLEPQIAQTLHQGHQSLSNEGFATRETNGIDPEAFGHLGETKDLVKAQQLITLHEGHALFGHAVDASQVAPIGY
jgi:hypothetical protein